MKTQLLAIFCLVLFSNSFGQNSISTPSPEQTRIENFGSSVKGLGKEEKRKSQSKQTSNDISDHEVIKVSTDLAVSDVLVTDQKANLITWLRREDFIVMEDGIPQTIEFFSVSRNSRLSSSIVLILDFTLPQGPYLKNSLIAGKQLVDRLGPTDRMAIVIAGINLQLNFTRDKTLLKKTLDSLQIRLERIVRINSRLNDKPKLRETLDSMKRELDGLDEFHNLLAVLNEIFEEDDQQRIVVFQTDGVHGMWLKPDKDTPYKVSYSTLYNSGMKWTGVRSIAKFGFSDVKEAIERSRVTIYSIIPGIKFLGFSQEEQLLRAERSLDSTNRIYGWHKPSDMPAVKKHYKYSTAEANIAGQTAMFKVAEWSGGNAGFMEKPEDAEAVYSDIFKVIDNRYILGYYPTNQNRDGKLRNVRIAVKNHPEYIVTTRKTYYAPEE